MEGESLQNLSNWAWGFCPWYHIVFCGFFIMVLQCGLHLHRIVQVLVLRRNFFIFVPYYNRSLVKRFQTTDFIYNELNVNSINRMLFVTKKYSRTVVMIYNKKESFRLKQRKWDRYCFFWCFYCLRRVLRHKITIRWVAGLNITL
jgi:hypothetical protein